MKQALLLLATLMSTSTHLPAVEEKPVGLDDLHWKNRVLLVFARASAAPAALGNLEGRALEIDDRDLLWFLLADDALHTNFSGEPAPGLREQLLERYFTPAPEETLVILIGKDGTVKSKGPDLDLEATFDLIDRMPMRRAEMRQADKEPD